MPFPFFWRRVDSLPPAPPPVLPPALELTWADLCEKNEGGGITLFIILVITVIYFTVNSEIFIVGRRRNPHPIRSYYDQHQRPNSSLFRKFMVAFEKACVLPFIPSSTHIYVMWLFMFCFITTIPMAVTRYYKNRWIHDLFVLQGLFNLISMVVLRCKPLHLTAIEYTEDLGDFVLSFPPSGTDKWQRIDSFFTVHLAVGVIWLCFGFFQIFKAQDSGWSFTPSTNWATHRGFGGLAFLSVFVHIFMMAYMTLENPVHQNILIRGIYLQMVINAVNELKKAYYYAKKTKESGVDTDEKKENKTKHEMHAFFLYARTIMGSGPIRLFSWLLWLVGHFVSPEYRLLIDRAACQNYAETKGDATDCWRPVAFSHILTGVFTVYLEVLFLAMKEYEIARGEMEQDQVKQFIKKARRKKQSLLEQHFIWVFVAFTLILIDTRVENWLNSEFVNLPGLIKLVIANAAEIVTVFLFLFDLMSDPVRELLYDYKVKNTGDRLTKFLIWLYCLNNDYTVD